MAYYEGWYIGQMSSHYYRKIVKADSGAQAIVKFKKGVPGMLLEYQTCYTVSKEAYLDYPYTNNARNVGNSIRPLDPEAKEVVPSLRKVLTSHYME